MSEEEVKEETTDQPHDKGEAGETEEIRDPKAVLAALERAKSDAQKYREEAEALQKDLAKLREDYETFSSSSKQTVDGLKAKYIDMHVESALKGAGAANIDRLKKFLDKENITVDDDHKVVGIEDAITGLQKDFPELFDAKKRVGGNADIYKTPEPKVSKTTTEMQLERLRARS